MIAPKRITVRFSGTFNTCVNVQSTQSLKRPGHEIFLTSSRDSAGLNLSMLSSNCWSDGRYLEQWAISLNAQRTLFENIQVLGDKANHPTWVDYRLLKLHGALGICLSRRTTAEMTGIAELVDGFPGAIGVDTAESPSATFEPGEKELMARRVLFPSGGRLGGFKVDIGNIAGNGPKRRMEVSDTAVNMAHIAVEIETGRKDIVGGFMRLVGPHLSPLHPLAPSHEKLEMMGICPLGHFFGVCYRPGAVPVLHPSRRGIARVPIKQHHSIDKESAVLVLRPSAIVGH